MRIAALVLGIVGGVFGIIAGIIAMTVGGIGAAFESEESGLVAGLGFSAILLGVLGIVGGALVLRYPRVSAMGAALAFFGRRQSPTAGIE